MNTIIDVESFETYLRRRGLGERTITAYGRDVRQFFTWIDRRGRTGDLASDVLDWVNEIRATDHSASTVRRYMVSARNYLTFLQVPTTLLDGYKAPPLPDANPTPLLGGIEQGRALIADADGAVRVVMALQLFAGLRVSEAVSIERKDVNTARGQLRVKGKGEKVRYVPLSPELAALLEESPADGRLAPISNAAARFAIARAGARADAGQISSHDLRATFATHVFATTKDILLVSRLLGHASVATTQKYLGFDRNAAAAAVDFR